ncbi:glutathioneS-transferase [Moniliophthora roreri MCA 2997]|uniref:glutathione transferase n=2 Tax=Moniliophthora roreri TaxID=221103 RepID=V2Y2Q1_MONRO|nr:glutathioneS-transferase [Moniliophthora roreri MCA 2997]KAI3614966.1 glutathioneS-transferase [Moniliophthora roreri]
MVLQIYGSSCAPCTQRVSIILYEKKIPYEFHAIDLGKGEQRTPEYLAKQPFGKIPYIEDDGFIVYESRAIARYLAMKYHDRGSKLVPDMGNLKAVTTFEQAASIEMSSFDPYAGQAAWEGIFKKTLTGVKPDPKVFQEIIATLGQKLKGYEAILGKQKYLAGDELTIVDLFHLPYGSLLSAAGSNIMSCQGLNVTRWWNELLSRPSWKAVVDGIPDKRDFLDV